MKLNITLNFLYFFEESLTEETPRPADTPLKEGNCVAPVDQEMFS